VKEVGLTELLLGDMNQWYSFGQKLKAKTPSSTSTHPSWMLSSVSSELTAKLSDKIKKASGSPWIGLTRVFDFDSAQANARSTIFLSSHM